MMKPPHRCQRFPVIENDPSLRNLMVAMYVVKHLRGNAILDASHENNTYTEEQLALALVSGKVVVPGAFLRAD
jgi:hypothetical protein